MQHETKSTAFQYFCKRFHIKTNLYETNIGSSLLTYIVLLRLKNRNFIENLRRRLSSGRRSDKTDSGFLTGVYHGRHPRTAEAVFNGLMHTFKLVVSLLFTMFLMIIILATISYFRSIREPHLF